MDPVSVHVAYIRHLARPAALEPFLCSRHGISKKLSKTLARKVAPFLGQAIAFHDASRPAPLRVRSVFQYYAYLNLAVALVLIYRPRNWEEYQRHGVEDITRNLRRLSLSSHVLRVHRGALPLFHSILSRGQLPATKITLRDLITQIPMLSSELKNAFRIRLLPVLVSGEVKPSRNNGEQTAQSYFTFKLSDPNNLPSRDPGNIKFPLKRLYRVMPDLQTNYRLLEKKVNACTFASSQKWTLSNKERADKFHEGMALKFMNFGGQTFNKPGSVSYSWWLEPNSNLLPTLTAGLLLAFVLASLSRYRANLLDRVESSKLNLLFEVFANEADGFLIPALRNLLFAEISYISRVDFT